MNHLFFFFSVLASILFFLHCQSYHLKITCFNSFILARMHRFWQNVNQFSVHLIWKSVLKRWIRIWAFYKSSPWNLWTGTLRRNETLWIYCRVLVYIKALDLGWVSVSIWPAISPQFSVSCTMISMHDASEILHCTMTHVGHEDVICIPASLLKTTSSSLDSRSSLSQ